ncbi:DUF6017 domain-containing protein [Acutalibacter muris]|uniref:DUF6017 domain-containing protein n=1 Tax=Acutalibacter muris TaxID=1796620 RepID=UPI001C3EDB52|nr:DUF6017 domain-containing protein [Acutalibacter muris]
MKKLKLEPLRPQTARGYRYLAVPKELIKNRSYSSLDFGAVFLYARMMEIVSLSAQNEDKFTDKKGLFIIYTVERMEQDLQRSHPTIVKWTKQLENIGLIEKVRQGQGKPSKIYIYDFTTAPHDEPEKPTSKDSEPQEVKDFNFTKSTAFTSRSKEIELQEVKDFNAIELDNKDLENTELPPSQPPSGREDGGAEEPLDVEEVQAQVRRQVEYTVLCENYDEEIADEVVEIITEVRCRDSPKMQIGAHKYPMDFVRKRMESLTYEHVCYVLDNLGRAGPVRNPHNYLLTLLFNAPAGCSTAVHAVYNENLGK